MLPSGDSPFQFVPETFSKGAMLGSITPYTYMHTHTYTHVLAHTHSSWENYVSLRLLASIGWAEVCG